VPRLIEAILPLRYMDNARLAHSTPRVYQGPPMCPDTRYRYVSQKPPATPASAYLPAHAWVAIAGDNSPRRVRSIRALGSWPPAWVAPSRWGGIAVRVL